MKEEIMKNLIVGNFSKVDELLKGIGLAELETLFIDKLCYEYRDLSTYTYINYRISKAKQSELVRLHIIACAILIIYFAYVEGAYSSGLYHAKKAVELESDNVECLELLLSFYGLPEQLMEREEAKKIAKKIIKIKKTSISAKNILESE